MKKSVLLFVGLVAFYTSYSQHIPDNLVEDIVDKFKQKIKKNATGGKILVCSFSNESKGACAKETKMGIDLAQKISFKLKTKLEKLDQWSVLIPEKNAETEALMKSMFRKPNNEEEESAIYQQMQENQRPDYYLEGSFVLENNSIRFSSCILKPDKYQTSRQDIIITSEDLVFKVSNYDEFVKYAKIINTPVWVDNVYNEEHFEEYFWGNAIQKEENEDVNKILSKVKAQAFEQLCSKLLLLSNQNLEENDKNTLEPQILNLTKLKKESYTDCNAKEAGAFYKIKKTDLLTYIGAEYTKLEKIIIDNAKIPVSNPNAHDEYQEALIAYEKAELFLRIEAKNNKNRDRKAFDNAYKTIKQNEEKIYSTLQTLTQLIDNVVSSKEIATHSPVYIYPITYHKKEVVSPLSEKIEKNLKSKLLNNKMCKLADEKEAKLKIKINYIEEGATKIAFECMIYNHKNELIKTILPNLLISQLENVDYKPTNIDVWTANKEIEKSSPNTNSKLEVNSEIVDRQNHIKKLFTEDDKLKIKVKLNSAGYIRIIYRFADGQMVLLKDNFQITDDQINEMIMIDENFIVASPFGKEHLIVAASTSKHPSIKTKSENGYSFILGDYVKLVNNMRSVNNETYVEEITTVTTQSKH